MARAVIEVNASDGNPTQPGLGSSLLSSFQVPNGTQIANISNISGMQQLAQDKINANIESIGALYKIPNAYLDVLRPSIQGISRSPSGIFSGGLQANQKKTEETKQESIRNTEEQAASSKKTSLCFNRNKIRICLSG